VFASIGGLPFQFLFTWYHFTQMKRELKCLIKKREIILVTCFFFKEKRMARIKINNQNRDNLFVVNVIFNMSDIHSITSMSMFALYFHC
jgi:hypothetical protein